MKRILLIEDDRVISDIYRERLGSEGFTVDVATDGASGLKLFDNRKPDLVLLDLMLPQVSGVEVLKKIRTRFGSRELPVLVLTNAFLGGSVQHAWEAGANQVLTKATMTPKLIISMIKNALNDPPPSATFRCTRTRAKSSGGKVDASPLQKCLDAVPDALEALWKPLKALVADQRNLVHLRALSQEIRTLAATAGLADWQPFAQMTAACEALFNDLLAKPEHVTPSVLLTVAQAIDALKFLFQHHAGSTTKSPAASRILVVDDDQFTHLAVSQALQKVSLRATRVNDPVGALKRRTGTHFDLIFLDIEMPGTNGFQLCTQLRAMPAYKQTPIIFLSMHADVAHRVESVLRGGDDFITKPFLNMELAVKALSYVIKGRVHRANVNGGSNGNDSASGFSRRDLNALRQAVMGSLDS